MNRERDLFRHVLKVALSKEMSTSKTLAQLGINDDGLLLRFLEYVDEKSGGGKAQPLTEKEIVTIIESDDELDTREIEQTLLRVYRLKRPTVQDLRRHVRSLVKERKQQRASSQPAKSSTSRLPKPAVTSTSQSHESSSSDDSGSERKEDADPNVLPLVGSRSYEGHRHTRARFFLTPKALLAALDIPTTSPREVSNHSLQ